MWAPRTLRAKHHEHYTQLCTWKAMLNDMCQTKNYKLGASLQQVVVHLTA